MIIPIAVTFLILFGYNADAQKKTCELLLECLEEFQAKHQECLLSRPNRTTTLCLNETLQKELEDLTKQKADSIQLCLKNNMEDAVEMDKSRRRFKRCENVIQNRIRGSDPVAYDTKEGDVNNNGKKGRNMRNSCFQDVRRIKNECSQLARCYSILLRRSKKLTNFFCYDSSGVVFSLIDLKQKKLRAVEILCKAKHLIDALRTNQISDDIPHFQCYDTNEIDQEIDRKRRQMRKALFRCRREKRKGRKGRKLHQLGRKNARVPETAGFHLL
uniref:Venom protein n=1 Tax=Syphacia muris TaxID=451379 RepID=A0A0N5AS32_9BILA